MAPRFLWLAGFCALSMAADASPQVTTRVEVDALVNDASGEPVAGAKFGDSWAFSAGSWRSALSLGRPGAPEEKAPLISDLEGRLRGTWIMDPFAAPLLGLSADGGLAIFVTADYEIGRASCRERV